MKGTVKIISILLVAIMLVSISTVCFATEASLIDDIEAKTKEATVNSSGATTIAGKIIKVIRVAAIIVGAVLIAVFGIKFMIGSAEEKAEYKKSFIPLIIGMIVVFGSTYLAQLLFSTFTS